jgi:hypothetical protein
MKDLYRCLEDQPPELLQAIAAAWQVSLLEDEPHGMVLRLGNAMLEAGALERVLAALAPQARAALDDLVRAGGVLPTQRLAPTYGEIRRFGPARLAREQPWQQPGNPLEELYFRGLIDRAYATVGALTGQALLVPNQLLALLVPLVAASPSLDVVPSDPPAESLDDGHALVEDLFALLVTVRQGHVPAPAVVGAGHAPRPWPRLELGARLLGEPNPTRLALIAELAARLGLTREVEGWLRPGPRAREWLRLSDARRLRSVYVAWRDDPRWNELAQVQTLRYEAEVNPATARRALLRVLAECPAGRWLALDSVLQAIKRQRPDYLRPDGDVAWHVRDAATGEPLSGAASWDRVEGAVARHVLTSSLRWLGVVATGRETGAVEPHAVYITARGQALFGMAGAEQPNEGTVRRAPAQQGDSPHADEGAERPLATITDDLVITVPLENTLHERYQLERFAGWERQDRVATYRVTADSLWRGYNGGVEVALVVKFLTRISGDRMPEPALRDLLAWGGRFGHARLREMVLLQTDDERTMKQITSRAELRALLGTALSPTTCLVERNKADKLLQQLKALGIWPKLDS